MQACRGCGRVCRIASSVTPCPRPSNLFDLTRCAVLGRLSFGVRLSLSCVLLFCLLLVLFVLGGAVGTRVEPWTGLHCSELHWRCPAELSAVQSRAPVSSKVCEHGSLCSCDFVTLVMAYSQGEWPEVRYTAKKRLGSAVGLLGR